MSDETVKECLSHQNVMTLHRHTSHKNDKIRTNKWPQFMPNDVQHDDIYVMNEFICKHCRNSLRHKKTKMPDQTCANSLQLHNIPHDLQSISIGEKSYLSHKSHS